MNIGTTIKKYRRQLDFTQEQLAEYLNVSVSAVSQWESGKTIPDISTSLTLANFFDITLDELFDRTSREKEKDLAEYDALDRQYAQRGEVKKQLALWREAVQKYPREFSCLIDLANALEASIYSFGDSEEKEKNAKESVAVCQRILKDCNDSNIRSRALQILVHVYSYKDLSLACEEKAVEYAMMADSLFTCRELLLEFAYFTEESRESRRYTKHSNMLSYMDLLTQNLYYGQFDREEQKMDACNAALTLWKTLIYDENYQFYHCRLEKIYMCLASSCAKLGKVEETVEALQKALYHATCFDSLPHTKQHYTSVFVNGATSDASGFSRNYTCTNAEDVIRFSKGKRFDFVRDKLNLESV